MKFPGGNPLLFCEQVSTVTSFFEQWNDCERTVVLYALLKRVPFANLKFLQLSIDYNLAQNYSTQSKLQLLETHANNANFLNKLVQRYQTSGDVVVPASTTNGQLTISDSGFQEISTSSTTTDKKNTSSSSTFDLSSGSSASSTTSSSSSTSTSSTDPAKNGSEKAPSTTESTATETTTPTTTTTTTESKKDILNDMLTYLPLLKPGNDDVKSVYMSLIPAAVEDACQRAVPTELVQHILSYLLIHPAVNNDDRRSLSYWLRHLEEHIASTYIPTTLATSSATANNNNNTNSSNSKLATVNNNNNNNNYYTQNNHHHHSHHQQTSKPGSQQSLQFLAATATAAPWHHLHPPQQQQQNQHPVAPAAIGSSSSSSLLSISNSSLLSKSQQSLNQSIGGGAGPGGGGGGGGSSTSSSSSGLDSGASQLKTAGSGSSNSSISISAASANNSSSSTTASTMMVNLDWTTSTQQAVVAEVGGGSGGGDGKVLRGSMENVTLKEFGPVTFSYPRDHQLSSQAAAAPPSSQALNGGTSANNSSSGGGGGPGALNGSVATSVLADLDSSSDDNHLSFSKNGTEIFDYDCDYDNEEEFYNLARAAAAAAAASIPVAATAGTAAAGSVVTPGVGTGGKNRVSFDANISDYLRVPPIGDLELDGSGLLKTRRSNSLTTTVSSGCGLAGVGEQLHHQQKQNNECLSAENLSQLMQNKPRSFSLTMESPRSSLTSSGSETRLDDFKQHHHMMKMYGTAPNVGMASIAHWLKSLRLHKYVWLFSNLTYEQMMEMTEEYLASLGVTKGARHKLVLCIQKLRERYATMVRLEKELLAAGGGVASKAILGTVFEELTNIVLTPMKPAGTDPKEDIGTQFLKLLDLIASILLVRAAASPQDEEYLNVYCWLLERAMHNEAFSGHVIQLKEYKYKANKVKMQYAPKGGSHYGKSSGGGGLGGSGGGLGVGLGGGGSGVERGIPMNGNLGKPRWSVSNKHNKPCGSGSSEGLQKSAPHRKSSLQYFSSPMQSNQQNPTPGAGNSSATHLQAIPPHGYYGASAGGTGHNNSYNKSSSYPNFASNLSGGGDSATKHHRPPPQHVTLGGHQSQQQQVPPPPQQQPPHVPPHGTNFMYHRHSLNNISAHQHQQQFLQQLQQSQQQQQSQLLPSIYLTTMGGVPGGGKKEVPVPKEQHHHQQKSDDSGKSQNNNNNNSIGDINSRLEFLCLQMTEQAIN